MYARACLRTYVSVRGGWPWLYLRRRKRHITFNLPPSLSTLTSRESLAWEEKREKSATRRATPFRSVPFRSIPFRPMTHSSQACESRSEYNTIKLREQIKFRFKFRKIKETKWLLVRNRVSIHFYIYHKNK